MIPSLAALLGHHIALVGEDLPDPSPGITWLWGTDGIYKRGISDELDVLIRVGDAPHVPGLAQLLPSVRFRRYGRRLPGQLLGAILTHARKVCTRASGLAVMREQQYFITRQGGTLHARVPAQDASAGRVHYQTVAEPVLLDLHSHHQMAAYFSATDDADDTGLGVSAVIGRIFDQQPEIAVRLCCYGHTQRVPPLVVFDSLGPFRDPYEDCHADAHD